MKLHDSSFSHFVTIHLRHRHTTDDRQHLMKIAELANVNVYALAVTTATVKERRATASWRLLDALA